MNNIFIYLSKTCLLLVFIYLNFGEARRTRSSEDYRPYGHCPQFSIGGSGRRETDEIPMKNGSKFSFYPMIDDDNSVYFYITFPDVVYKVKISGSYRVMEECDAHGENCEEYPEGLKGADFITPHTWNEVSASIENDKISIKIGRANVMTTKMQSSYMSKMDQAKWKILINENESKENAKSDDPEYLVQFACHQKEEEGKANYPSSHIDVSDYTALIVAVVFGALILIIISVILFIIIKNRKNYEIKDTTRLNPVHK